VISHQVDYQVHYVDLNEVVSRVRSIVNQDKKKLVLKDFVQTINLNPMPPQLVYFDVRSRFEKSYWCGCYSVKRPHTPPSKEIWCKPRANLNDMLPEAILMLSNNSDLYNTEPIQSKYLFKDNRLYLSLRADLMASSICLAIFRLDHQANTFIKVCSKQFELPKELVPSKPPRKFIYIYYNFCELNHLITIKNRVFSVAQPGLIKNRLWIHCFMRNKILPIAGANTKVPGFYSLNSTIRLQFDYCDGNVVGLYGVDEIHLRRGNDRVYKTWRYVLV
jgi:hypothetical protein